MIATVGSEAKAAVARDCSGDHAIRYTQENFMARVAQVTAGHGVDVAYTLIGAESVAFYCASQQCCIAHFQIIRGVTRFSALQSLKRLPILNDSRSVSHWMGIETMFKEMKISTRLAVAFGTILLLMICVVALGISRMSLVNDGLHTITAENDAETSLAIDMRSAAFQVSISIRNLMLYSDNEKLKSEYATLHKAISDFDSASDALDQMFSKLSSTTPTEKNLLASTIKQWKEALLSVDQVAKLCMEGKGPQGFTLYMSTASKEIASMRDTLNQLAQFEQKLNAEEVEKSQHTYATARRLILGISALAVLLGIAAAVLVTRGVLSQLGAEPAAVAAIVSKVAQGNFSSKIIVKSGDQYSLLATMAQMQADLKARTERDQATAAELQARTERELAAAAENARIRVALDKSSTSTLIADVEGTIIYANDAMSSLLRTRLGEIRQHAAQFDPNQLVGFRLIDQVWIPSDQRPRLASTTTAYTAEVVSGDARLRITATPVIDPRGQRMGVAVQCIDRTEEVRTEEEIATMVQGALAGDLTVRVGEAGKAGFFAVLAKGMNALMESTTELIRTVGTAAKEVATGVEEIAKGNVDLSQRTEEQASSLEETASSMEQMTSTIKQNADNAAQANALAAAARGQAEKGGTVVASAVSAMGEINVASKKIADIIGVIDEIAFQTNLLALNAAVEAARAGEQGRGFAVVASEVRSLAGRSATAAKEIKELIQDSVNKVEQGSTLVDQSGHTLAAIVLSVKKVSDIVAEIAAASAEQASGVEQVNKAITQMDEVTQQNAALVEEAAAAAQALQDQSASLQSQLERYTVGGEKAASTVARPARAVAKVPDRRQASRPWSGAKKTPRASEPMPSAERPSATAVGGDSEWQEF